MSKQTTTKGKTSRSLPVFIQDTTSTTGGGLSGVTSASSGLVLEYRRQGQSSWTSVTPVAGKTLGTYLSGGIVADGSLAGAYEVDFPDAAFASASGVEWVACRIRGVANMLPALIEVQLDTVDYQTDAFGALKPTTAGRTLDVSAGGEAGIDLANVGSPTTTLNLSGVTIKTATDIETDTQDIQSRIPAALVDGRMVSLAQAVTDKTAYKLASDGLSLVTAWAVAITGNITGNLVGDVTGEVAQLGPNALSANSLDDQISLAVWNALTTATYVNQSFGDRLLISTNNTRQIAVTGSNHVASVLHDAEPNSIPEDAFVSNAISARVIATDAIDADALADGAITAGVFAADSITATALATSAAVEIAGKVWDEALTNHLTNGSTGYALNNAGGSGNPWITDLATGYTGTQAGNILNQVKAKTDLITTGTIQSSIPVTAQGQITGPLFIGDDYLSANGRAFQWTVALPSGFVIATSTCRFGMEHAEGATEGASFAVAGTVTDAGGGNVTLSFSVPRATTGTLKAGFYRWSVEIASASGNEVTRVASDGKKLVEWREKQT